MIKYYIIVILVIILFSILIWQAIKHSKSKFKLPNALGKELPLKFNTTISKSPSKTKMGEKKWHICRPVMTTLNDPARFSTFDARLEWPGCISRIYTQGQCGSCWAFASITTLASRFCIATCKYNKKPPNQIINTCYSNRTLNRKAQAVLVKLRTNQVKREYSAINTISSAIAPTFEALTFSQWEKYFKPSALELIKKKTSNTPIDNLFKVINQQVVQKPQEGDAREVVDRALKQSFLYFDINRDGIIDIHEWREAHLYGPISLSVQVPITCMLSDDGPISQVYNTACAGSTLQRAWQYLCSWGTPDEYCAGYTLGHPLHTKKDSKRIAVALCPQEIDTKKVGVQRREPGNWHCTQKDAAFILFRALNAYIIGSKDWTCHVQFSIMREIATRGPVSAAMRIHPSFMGGFAAPGGAGGQGYWKKGGKWPPVHRALGSDSSSLIYTPKLGEEMIGGHAVMIIGWGEFIDDNEIIPYWIIANSWGTTWGTSGDTGKKGLPKSFHWDEKLGNEKLGNGGGYFWLLRGANACGIEELIVAGIPDVDGVVKEGSTPHGLVFSDSGIPRDALPCGSLCIPNKYDGPCNKDGKCDNTGAPCPAGEKKWSTCMDLSYGTCKNGKCSKHEKVCKNDEDCKGGDAGCCMTGSGRNTPCITSPDRLVTNEHRGTKLANVCKCEHDQTLENHPRYKEQIKSSVIDNVMPDWEIPNGIGGSVEECKKICNEHPDCTGFARSYPHYFDPVDFIWKVGKPDQQTIDNILKQKHIKARKDPFDRDTTMHDKKQGGSVSYVEDVEHIVPNSRCWFHGTHEGKIDNKFFDLYTTDGPKSVICEKGGDSCVIKGKNGICKDCQLKWVPGDKKSTQGAVYFKK
jgi:hypothetical protein